jgi:hypothetical protein
MLGFYHIPGSNNPADILSKHWGYSQVWDQLKTLLFWKGDTGLIQVQGQDTPPSAKRGVTKSTPGGTSE